MCIGVVVGRMLNFQVVRISGKLGNRVRGRSSSRGKPKNAVAVLRNVQRACLHVTVVWKSSDAVTASDAVGPLPTTTTIQTGSQPLGLRRIEYEHDDEEGSWAGSRPNEELQIHPGNLPDGELIQFKSPSSSEPVN